MQNIKDILNKKSLKGDRRNTYEFQAYGNLLADEFGDTKHRSLYIKLAKSTDRVLLERARDYVKASEKATTKGRLFMWKLSELKKELKKDKA
jgi:hypothetical protein